MKLSYIKIQQKNETFFLTKMKASLLREKVNFHFRQPYTESARGKEKIDKYLESVRKKGLAIENREDGIQRRLQLSKINSIKEFLEEEQSSFFPNTVILSVDVSKNDDFLKSYDEIENKDFGELELPDDVEFQIVDGQHRLAGLFISDPYIQKNFDVPIVLLLNVTINTCAKIFSDVNGNQSTVNKSVIYDLYDMIDSDEKKNQVTKNLHAICKKFNNDFGSPLYQHIKMLGIGDGAISQAFFIKTVGDALSVIGTDFSDIKSIYYSLFYYYRSFQRVFSQEWPVPEWADNDEIIRNYSDGVMKENKSQILKTNGFGALMLVYPLVYKAVKEQNFESYFEIISKLEDKIDWCRDSLLTSGTGKKVQNAIKERILTLLGISEGATK